MRIFVKAEAFDSIHGAEQVAKLREAVGWQINRIVESGKLELGWITTDKRCPMFILDVESASEVMELLGGTFLDNFNVETHPIVSLEELAQFFQEHPPGQ